MTNEQRTEGADRRVGVALAVLVSLTVLFLGLSVLHERPMEAFELRTSSFSGFSPRLDGWSVEALPVPADPIEPNILCYRLTPRAAMGGGLRAGMALRLVHGYNVRDCMRIKGYQVEEVRGREQTTDYRPQTIDQRPQTVDQRPQTIDQRPQTIDQRPQTIDQRPQTIDQRPQTIDHGPQTSERRTPSPKPGTKNEEPRTRNQEPETKNQEPAHVGQIWRMVSPAGVTSLWATVMLRADTFEATDRDVCSMPFPRVGIPDDPDWSPGGITVEGLRHPVASARRVVRAKWNASRSDLLTFLGFRRPTWVQSEWLTLVVAGESGTGEGECPTAGFLRAVQSAFVRQLRDWHRERGDRRP